MKFDSELCFSSVCIFHINVSITKSCTWNILVRSRFAIVEDSSTSNVILLGDFNADVDTLFETELMEMCDSLNLLIYDYSIFGRSSGQYTRVSDAHNTTSWLGHIICSHDVQNKFVCINVLDRLPCSDHLPLCVLFDLNCNPIVTST